MSRMGRLWFGYFGMICFFGAFVNVLFLAIPIYLMVVYDRVLYSFSISSLVSLSIGLLIVSGVMAVMEYLCASLRIKAGAFLEKEWTPRVLAHLHQDAVTGKEDFYERGFDDLSCLKESIWDPRFLQIIHLPWILIYFAVLFFFHPWIALFAAGAFFIAEFFYFLTRIFCRSRIVSGDSIYAATRSFVNETCENAELVSGMGILPGISNRFAEKQRQIAAMVLPGEFFMARINAVVFFISIVAVGGVYGLGAYLYFDGHVTTGAMLASVLVVARLFYPFGSKFEGLRQVVRARAAYKRLKTVIDFSKKNETLDLPRPDGRLSAEGVVLIRNNRQLLQNINFEVDPGESLGITGPTGAGKSILLKLLLGVWAPTSGKIRLDGVDTASWDNDAMGPYIGYVPQTAVLLSGKVSQNIARFAEVDSEQVIKAAQKAGAHEMILSLTDGYDTQVGKLGPQLSQGQSRRIAVSASLYGDPALVVMDRPNSDLDEAGMASLLEMMKTLKQEKTTLVMVTENPRLLVNTDKILLLKEGQVSVFGPSKEVLTNLRNKQVVQQG
jgi:ATP-binding cassette, subfamily C, bacterial EexD